LANPLDGQALLLFADHLLDQNQTEHAIMRLEQAAAAEGFEAPARRRLGEVLAGRGDYARAVSELRKALEIEPADQTLRDYLDSISRLAGLGERR
ncbi:MAG: tetratricopeptide (TPR) repeat protein, partial [Verrucomicrobiales bacterium]